MNLLLVFGILFLISLIIALRSMGDIGIPKEIRRLIDSRRVKGTILFFGGKSKHYRAK